MILILGHAQIDSSTEMVQDWIHRLGGNSLRINGDDLIGGKRSCSIELKPGRTTVSRVQGIDISAIKVIWYRRWLPYSMLGEWVSTIPAELSGGDRFMARSAIVDEALQFSRVFFESVSHCHWIPKYRSTAVSKFQVLTLANEVGLNIPETLVTNSKTEVRAFWHEHHRSLITKPLYQMFGYSWRGQTLVHHTAAISSDNEFARIPEPTFFPSLFQRRVPKQYEVRTFYFCGRIISMAMFSQQSARTMVDFRVDTATLQSVPYQLPRDVEDKIHSLMERLDLSTGSIDFIKDVDGEYVFLEVNPLCQFGMTAIPSGIGLEKMIAEHLIALCA